MTARWMMLVLLLVTGCGTSGGDKAKSASPTVTPNGTETKPVAAVAKPPKGKTLIFSLVNQQVHAHRHSGGRLVVDGGLPGFAKYMRYRRSNFPWSLGESVDGRKAAVPDGSVATIKVPLTKEQAESGKVVLSVYSDAPGKLSLRPNSDKDKEARVTLAGGWVEFVVQLQNLQAGENDLQFFFGGANKYALGTAAFGENDGPLTMPKAKDSALELPDGSGLAYYAFVPDGSVLFADLKGSCELAVAAQADGKKTFTAEMTAANSRLEMADMAGMPVRLSLTAKGCDQTTLENAGLYSEVTEASNKAEPPQNVILWIMDSLRADRIRTFHPKAVAETPHFDALSKKATFFTHAYVQGNESRASHASIWSSLYPVKHRMISSKSKLDYKWKTIDEVAKEAKLKTVGVSANGYVAKKWGFNAAFDEFTNHIHDRGGLKGEDILEKATKLLGGFEKPFFLYLGTIDTHVSWRAKEPWMSKYKPDGYSGRFKTTFSGSDAGKAAGGKLNLSDNDIANIRAIYDSNVSYQDDLLGKLVADLEAAGVLDKTMIVITADHGDEQWEHGRVGHGGSLRETLIHVPLIVHYPPLFPAKKVDDGVEVIDIVPTVADALGQKADERWQGFSLVDLANRSGHYPTMNLASQFENAHAGAIAGWKLVAAGARKPKLFHVAKDPGENSDLVDSHPIARRFVADSLWILRANNKDWSKKDWQSASNVSEAFATSLRQ